MSCEHIHAPPHPDGAEGLLAIVVRSNEEASPGVTFHTTPELPQQVATIRHPRGHVVEPHQHLPLRREIHATTEVLIVRSGRMRLDLFTSYRDHVGSWELGPEDVVILISGGHGLTMLEETEFLEVKTGPYHGKCQDKMPLF